MTRIGLSALVAVVCAVAFPLDGHADGLPVEGVDASRSGVTSPSSADVRYVTLRVPHGTVVAAVRADGGQILRSRFLRGHFTIPVVAYDGSASGLSGDGQTLVLIRPRANFPRRRTTLALLEAGRLRLRDEFTLRGDFSFDAISPDGSSLYLVEYLSPKDPTRYLVRLYDLRAGRLASEPVIDPREVGDVMRGSPISRAASADGRWAYTLYDGAGQHPFIHALDTTGQTARCVDLHGLAGRDDLFELRLVVGPGGRRLTVVAGAERLAIVDLRSFRVTPPGSAAGESDDERGSLGRRLIAILGGLALAAAGAVRLARKRSAKRGLGRRSLEPPEVLVGVGDEVEIQLGDSLLDHSPHCLTKVGHEVHEAKRTDVLVR